MCIACIFEQTFEHADLAFCIDIEYMRTERSMRSETIFCTGVDEVDPCECISL